MLFFLDWQGKLQTVVAGGKASSGSIPKMAGCVLLLLAGEVSKRHTVVIGGVVRPLAVKASGDSIPEMAGCGLLLVAGKASGKLWWREALVAPWPSRPTATASPRWWSAYCFSRLARRVVNCDGGWQGQQQ